MSRPLIIAHRGASGYLPEHTLEAKALAYGQGADYLEQDVVATRDDRLVVLHDIHLERVTDVALRYPDRHRRDGRWYVRDFDLAELRTLSVHERCDAAGKPVFPGRFPVDAGRFRIATLEEELELVCGLNRSTRRTVGVYPEIKRPTWHRSEGVDVARLLLPLLADFGWHRREDPIFVQCFDADELRRLRTALGCDLKLVQLLEENGHNESDTDYAALQSPPGLTALARTVDAVGPSLGQLQRPAAIDGQPISTGLAEAAHTAGLLVHPYTFRADALPAGFASFASLVAWFATELGIDGLFTDFPDRALEAREGAAGT
ncbi:MAG TPA: glycerophosphodiester phosphodiesterase [Woeseiaceae bacterium]